MSAAYLSRLVWRSIQIRTPAIAGVLICVSCRGHATSEALPGSPRSPRRARESRHPVAVGCAALSRPTRASVEGCRPDSQWIRSILFMTGRANFPRRSAAADESCLSNWWLWDGFPTHKWLTVAGRQQREAICTTCQHNVRFKVPARRCRSYCQGPLCDRTGLPRA
jgi:hypothetical protein